MTFWQKLTRQPTSSSTSRAIDAMEIDESTTMETDEHITMPPPSSTDPVSSTEFNDYQLSCQIPPLKRKRDEE
jgi:hypothetical protein